MKSPIRVPRILLTNDDGIDAPGLAILADVAREFSDEVWIIAPEHDQSGAGQSITLNETLRAYPRGERKWAIAGTPGDCVVMALFHLMADSKPSLILSGINVGGNAGDEVNLSGTIGAAFTGLMFDVPSLAISQNYGTRESIRWDTARDITAKMVKYFLARGWAKDTCLSINIPDLPAEKISGFSWATQSHKNVAGFIVEGREDLRDEMYFWLNLIKKPVPKDKDACAILERGEVTVTALGINRSVEVKEPAVSFADAAE